jgi:hypothetical protein
MTTRLITEGKRLIRHGEDAPSTPGVRRNAAVTATTGLVLLLLLAVQLVTVINLHLFMIAHLVVGLLLIAPLTIKLASTSYRMLRYYLGAESYRRKGPPHPLMRLMAPLLVLSTVALMASGVALALLGPDRYRWLGTVHVASFWVWIFLAGAHVLVYVWRIPGLVRARPRRHRERSGAMTTRLLAIALNLAGLVSATLLVVALYPTLTAWSD